MEFSSAVLVKAQDFVRYGKVEGRGEWVFHVQGSAKTPYRVQLDLDPVTRKFTWASCTCRYGTNIGAGLSTCSHVAAVLITIRDLLGDQCPNGCGQSMPCTECGAGL